MAHDNQKTKTYVSDAIVDLLRSFQIEYVPLNPGASIRGIHDSAVNYGGNKFPELLLCCHEAIAVGIASGFYRATGKPLAVLVHNLEGLMHSTKAIFEAYLEREPMLIIGGNGPADIEERRPGIDWIHNALVPNTAVRDYTKWDDQPQGVSAVLESLVRAYRIATALPRGPVYLSVDAQLQEQLMPENIPVPQLDAFSTVSLGEGDYASLDRTAEYLSKSANPVFVADSFGRSQEAVDALASLAQGCGAPVLDTGTWFNFPSNHSLNLSGAEDETLAGADVAILLECRDIYSLLAKTESHFSRKAKYRISPGCKIIRIDAEALSTNSWVSDYGRLTPTDLSIAADSRKSVQGLLKRVRENGRPKGAEGRRDAISQKHTSLRTAWWKAAEDALSRNDEITYRALSLLTWQTVGSLDWVLAYPGYTARGINMWIRRLWEIKTTKQYPGRGGGTGTAIARAIGVALAYRNGREICIGFQPDGDLLYSTSALWTLSHLKLPLLLIVLNNHTYYNDEEHQRVVAVERGRPEKNKTVAIRIEDPIVDYATLAKSFGISARGPAKSVGELKEELEAAVSFVSLERKPCLLDIHVNPAD